MSSIKPPTGIAGGPGGPDGLPDDAGGAEPAGAVSDAQGSRGPVSATGPEGAASVGAGLAPDALADIARAVADGTLKPEAALEQLVERAVGPLVSKLSEAERDELVALLRDALAHDPALGALRDTLR